MTNPYDPTYTPSYASVPAGQADNDHLRILAICHYVCAAIQALTGLMPAFYLAMGVFFLTHSFPTPASTYPSTTPFASPYSASTASPASDEKVVGWVFVAMGSIGVIFVETCAFLTLLSGLSIAKRRRYMLIMISAGVNCLFMPHGTILAIFTFVVLLRPSVRNQFPR